MRVEIISLVAMTMIFLLAWFPASLGKLQSYGRRWLASNRVPVTDKELPAWAARCERAHNNLKDNFPGYVVAILALAITDRFNEATQTASVIYVVARIGHITSYGLGNVPLRGFFFFAGLFTNIFLLFKIFI